MHKLPWYSYPPQLKNLNPHGRMPQNVPLRSLADSWPPFKWQGTSSGSYPGSPERRIPTSGSAAAP